MEPCDLKTPVRKMAASVTPKAKPMTTEPMKMPTNIPTAAGVGI